MNLVYSLFSFLILSLFFYGCMPEKDPGLPALKDERSNSEKEKACELWESDQKWKLDSNEYADLFKIYHSDKFNKLVITLSNQSEMIFIKGPKDFLKYKCANYQWVKPQSQRIIALSTIYLPFFEQLNVQPLVVGVANGKWVHNSWFRSMMNNHVIEDLGPYEQINKESCIHFHGHTPPPISCSMMPFGRRVSNMAINTA